MPPTSSPSENPYPGIYKGRRFQQLNDAWQQVTEAIVKAHQSYYTQKKNPKIWHIVCRDKVKGNQHDCPFKIRVIKKDGEFELVSLKTHTCPSSTHLGWRIPNSTKFLAPHHASSVRADHKLKPKNIQNDERLQYCHRISYAQALRTKKKCRQDINGDRVLQFQLIKPMLDAMIKPSQPPQLQDGQILLYTDNGAGYTGFSMKGSQFSHAMVILNACINAFYNNRPLVCFDGGHMKSGGGVLYVATTLDPNEEILLLAWAIAENESTNTWRQFLRRFYEHVTPIEWAKALGPPDGLPA